VTEELTWERFHDFIGDLFCCGKPSLLEAANVAEEWEEFKPQIREWRRCYEEVVPALQIKLTETLGKLRLLEETQT
jgi:hypothetical protein